MYVRRFIISHDEAPKSLNAGGTGSRQHWGAAHREKKRWEETYGVLLMEAEVPRDMLFCEIEAWLTFKENRRRDPENFRPAVAKPFADTLVAGGWLPDDTREFFNMRDMHIAVGLKTGAKAKLAIQLDCRYESNPDY